MTHRSTAGGVRRRYDRVRRAMDVIIASFALVVLAPVMAVVAGLVLVTLGRPVLFRQPRPGYRGALFVLVKFRTMRPSGSTPDPSGDGDRLPRVGRLLRETSLDELPTLWNVVRGDMSLVGPRPLLPQYLDRYTPEQARRHDVRPGITGLAQVNGRNATSWEARLAYDTWYVAHRSMGLDLRILARTGWTVLRRTGITAPGRATVAEFRGASGSPASPAREPSP